MKHIYYTDEPAEIESQSGAKGIRLRVVIGEKEGAPNFFMRIVDFDPEAQSPNHSHPYEHENYIISGKGTLEVDGQIATLKSGDVVYIPPSAHHCFRTTEEAPMQMICLIPKPLA